MILYDFMSAFCVSGEYSVDNNPFDDGYVCISWTMNVIMIIIALCVLD